MKGVLKKLLGSRQYEFYKILYLTILKKLVTCRRKLHEYFGSYKHSKLSLNGLDDKLASYLNFRDGYFVEAGANDGMSQSNTYYLEKAMGWRGVLVEPIPRLFEKCKIARPNSITINCALVSSDNENIQIPMCDTGTHGLLSHVYNGQGASDGSLGKVYGRTLTSVLAEAGLERIDFLSLDVEGYEISALKGLDLTQFSPMYILVETSQIVQVERILCPFYEMINQLTGHDYLFRKRIDGLSASRKTSSVCTAKCSRSAFVSSVRALLEPSARPRRPTPKVFGY